MSLPQTSSASAQLLLCVGGAGHSYQQLERCCLTDPSPAHRHRPFPTLTYYEGGAVS